LPAAAPEACAGSRNFRADATKDRSIRASLASHKRLRGRGRARGRLAKSDTVDPQHRLAFARKHWLHTWNCQAVRSESLS
jgi:hypothetical protein